MDSKQMKNMIVLKDIPSNMVEEAFIVFKSNVKIHKTEKIDNNKLVSKEESKKEKDYMIKEAEMIVKNYVSEIEKRENELAKGNNNIDEKYKRLKYLTIFLGMFSVLSLVNILLR